MWIFFVVASCMMVLLGTVAGFRLLLPMQLGKWPTFWIWIAAQVLCLLPLGLLALRRVLHPPRALEWLQEAGWLTLGWLSLALFVILARDILLGGARVLAWFSTSPVLDTLRSAMLSRAFSLWLVVGVTLLVALGYWNASRMTRVVEVEVPVEGLHPDLDGLRIVQLSDLHIGPGIRRRQVEQVVEKANALQADLVAFTGDLADGMPADLAEEAAPLNKLQAPLGRWFITGNHEYYSDAPGWLQLARQLGFRTLVNEHALLERGQGRLLIAGVPDVQGGRFFRDHACRPDLALAGAPPADFTLMLAHQPAAVRAVAAVGADLMLSGHTHGGQYHPFTWMAGKVNPYLKGLNRHDERLWVYVSQGTGTWGPRIRVGTAPEITLLTLRSVAQTVAK